MNIIKKILKWLLCVILSFNTIFTISFIMNSNTIESIYYTIHSDKIKEDISNEGSFEEFIKEYDEICSESFKVDEFDDEETIQEKEIFNKYPVGATSYSFLLSNMTSFGKIIIISAVVGIVVGTAIYLLLDKNKKGIKPIVILYILAILVLGFLEGYQTIVGDDLNFIDYWAFPYTYIIPITVVFGIVILARIVRQKDLAKKLNDKLARYKKSDN